MHSSASTEVRSCERENDNRGYISCVDNTLFVYSTNEAKAEEIETRRSIGPKDNAESFTSNTPE